MCTNVCPCYTATDLSIDPPEELRGQDARSTYWQLTKEVLDSHNRTMDVPAKYNKKKYSDVEGIFVWDNDVSKSFNTFEDCIRYWYATSNSQGGKASTVDPLEEFGLTDKDVE